MWSSRRQCLGATLAALSGLSALALTGCGFQLRRPPELKFQSIALTGFAPRSPLGEELRRQLLLQVRVLDTPDKAEVVLHALEDQRERSVVASTCGGPGA